MTARVTDSVELPETPLWDDVMEGQEIGSPESVLDWRDVVLQISGSQDWNRVHYDQQFAQRSGHREVFFNTGWTSALLSRVITDWCGTHGWLSELDFRMRRMIAPGDTVRPRAKIVGKKIQDGRKLVELDVWLETDREGETTRGHAVVTLPQ